MRFFPRHFADAMTAAQHGRCGTLGCLSPTAWLQADHVIPWSRHGPTAMRNGKMRCDPCNKAKRDKLE